MSVFVLFVIRLDKGYVSILKHLISYKIVWIVSDL